MAKSINLEHYVEVPERIQRFIKKFPLGFLTSDIIHMSKELVVVKAYAYREPGDVQPATGLAAEPIPGKTPYTRDSEVMNAETSAWGRAIAALGFDFGKIASREEVRNRQYTNTDDRLPREVSDDPDGLLNPPFSGVI